MSRPSPAPDERTVATASLGEALAALRLLSDEAVRPMRQSLELHGQLTALATYRADDDTLQVIVRAALTSPWSNGQTEGQVTKVKLLKRQAYGRASLHLLRQRMLCLA
jgi:hypothetical protein